MDEAVRRARRQAPDFFEDTARRRELVHAASSSSTNLAAQAHHVPSGARDIHGQAAGLHSVLRRTLVVLFASPWIAGFWSSAHDRGSLAGTKVQTAWNRRSLHRIGLAERLDPDAYDLSRVAKNLRTCSKVPS